MVTPGDQERTTDDEERTYFRQLGLSTVDVERFRQLGRELGIGGVAREFRTWVQRVLGVVEVLASTEDERVRRAATEMKEAFTLAAGGVTELTDEKPGRDLRDLAQACEWAEEGWAIGRDFLYGTTSARNHAACVATIEARLDAIMSGGDADSPA